VPHKDRRRACVLRQLRAGPQADRRLEHRPSQVRTVLAPPWPNPLGAVGSQPLQAAAWRMIKVAYIRGTAERMPQLMSPVLPLESIELIELPTGHCPN
jgi:hypothetical protein